MTHVTIQLSDQDIRVLRARTGKRSPAAAVKAWITRADPKKSVAQLRAALTQSAREEAGGKGQRFKNAREAIRWLES